MGNGKIGGCHNTETHGNNYCHIIQPYELMSQITRDFWDLYGRTKHPYGNRMPLSMNINVW